MSEPAAEAGPGSNEPVDPDRPTYKGAPLDAERGPGLGCFWIQVVLLVAMLILTPVSVWIAAPSWVSAALLLLSLGLLFFVGQTSIFLLRLVAADRRAQRRPLREGARPTVGQLSRDAELESPSPESRDAESEPRSPESPSPESRDAESEPPSPMPESKSPESRSPESLSDEDDAGSGKDRPGA